MEYQQFETEMRRLAASYRVEVHAPTIAAYWVELGQADGETFRAACKEAIRSVTRFPLVADLVGLIARETEARRTERPDGLALPAMDQAAEYESVLAFDRAEVARLASEREANANRKWAPVVEPFRPSLPPPAEDMQPIAFAAIPYCITPFVIVPKKRGDRGGFVAQWAGKSTRSERADACAWRETREEVRNTMANLFADIQEVKS